MFIRFLIAILCVMSVIPASADPRWKIHTTFDGDIDYIFETPEYVYFTSRAMPDMGGQRRMSLFRYDKEGDEMQPLSTDNVLSSTTISMAQYNPQKGYVVVINTNYDITFLYDNGKVVTLPDYRLASLSDEKTVNSITVDPSKNRIYLATNFGYLSINDEKYEIAESRVYKEALKSVARIGEYFVLLKDNDLLVALADAPRLSLSDYEVKDLGAPDAVAPLSDTECLIFTKDGSSQNMILVEGKGSSIDSRQIHNGSYSTISNNKNGVLVATSSQILQVEPGGNIKIMDMPKDEYKLKVGSYNLSDIWYGKERKGLKSYKPGNGSSDWSVTREYMIPDSPSPFSTSNLVLHPSKGALVANFPYDPTFAGYPRSAPFVLTGYNDGRWINYAPSYTNEERANIATVANGIAIDPDNLNYVYVSTLMNGILRLNLNDSNDIIHMSKPADKDNGQPGFVKFVENQIGKNSWCCNFSAPFFDSAGNLWTLYPDYDNQTPRRIHLYCWEASDRKSTTSSEDIKLPKHVEIGCDYEVSNTSMVYPLRHSNNKNILLVSSRNYNSEIILIDTNGTPTDSSDDKVVTIKAYFDQEGNEINTYTFRSFWEDPANGNVWVCHSMGVFYFKPDDLLKNGTGNFNRVKVSRNDGTNLADYLLDKVTVNGIATDGNGRKWFSTLGGGLICTSSDGRIIEEEINMANSPIPSDDIYGSLYLPSSNSLLISTSEGIAEYSLTGKASGSETTDLKIYPNPVRPDYTGYVTIEGLPDRSLVKITDASGNIVKEFGPVSGDVQWNVTNHQFKRVSSGVYFVLASSGENESSFSIVGKILVVN